MGEATPIPVIIIGGYLGSGKTSLINACLQNGLRNAAIVVNDFGDINIDAALISQYSTDTVELSNGCICCSIGESLADTLFSILDRPQQPELIVIETSGVSDPASVAAYTHMKGLTNAGIMVLVDAVQATDVVSNPLLKNAFEQQVRSAHLIALTKVDIASSEEIATTHDLLMGLAPATHIISASPSAVSQLIDVPASSTTVPSATNHELHLVRSTHAFDMSITRDDLQTYLDNLDPSVIRVKGIVGFSDGSSVLIQKTGPMISITPTTLPPTGLVLLSTN